MTITPYTPQQFLSVAQNNISVSEKVSVLKRMTSAFPLDASARPAQEQLVDLLVSANRYDEALQQYRRIRREPGAGRSIDFKLLSLLLRTGRHNDVLRATAAASGPERDILRDLKLLELRIQALLAKGLFRAAHECAQEWLATYGEEGVPGTRFEIDVRSVHYLEKHLAALQRIDGPVGKAIFTALVPDSLRRWSQEKDVPIVFFKLIPARSGGQLPMPLLPGRHETASYFEERVAELNRGFDYLSSGKFSLRFDGLHTLYVDEGDLDPRSSGGHLLTSRVYAHTIPPIYKRSGDAFIMLIDYRAGTDGEAAYMGDGIIHLSASKMQTLVMMHEILHGLGATHQEWNSLTALGYRFDSEDRGLMTFVQGELVDLGLEEKNRALLGWDQVPVIRAAPSETAVFAEASNKMSHEPLPEEETATVLAIPASSELIPAL